jgi:hypothetical protein
MPQIFNVEDFNPDREIIRQSLNAISADIGIAMREAGLGAIPTYVVIPNSGFAVATVMTPLDPTEEVWARIMEIACRVIQERIGGGKLQTRAMAWTMANEPSGAADVAAGTIGEPPVSTEGHAVVA